MRNRHEIEYRKEKIIDSRDLVSRLEYLIENGINCTEYENDEKEELEKAIEEIEDYSGDTCIDGVTLISRKSFVDYCKDLCEDCGYVSKDMPDFIAIDWNQTANTLEVDYYEISLGGVQWLYR